MRTLRHDMRMASEHGMHMHTMQRTKTSTHNLQNVLPNLVHNTLINTEASIDGITTKGVDAFGTEETQCDKVGGLQDHRRQQVTAAPRYTAMHTPQRCKAAC
eukprot:9285022-Pyramimonas_sp.AAC.1